jgi:serine/threonine protein kinase
MIDLGSLPISILTRACHHAGAQVVRGELRTHARRILVAVKSLPGLTDDVTRARLDKELKAHITAQHVASGVCRLLGTCEKDRTICLVMKLYNGSLRDRITAGLDAGESRRVAHALARTLEQLHAAGVIVKDIKPENVLMDEFGQPVLADFGISEVVTRTTRIMPTSVQGTFSYMAPELFESEGHGPEVDVWSLACVISEMCTGVMPFAGLQMAQIMRAVCDRRVVPDVPDHAPAADVVRRCFAFKPAARPSAAELAAALAPEAAELPEVVEGMADVFARRVATLTAQLTAADAARVAAESERDRAVAAQVAADAGRDHAVAERDRARAESAGRATEIQRLMAQMTAASAAAIAPAPAAALSRPQSVSE